MLIWAGGAILTFAFLATQWYKFGFPFEFGTVLGLILAAAAWPVGVLYFLLALLLGEKK